MMQRVLVGSYQHGNINALSPLLMYSHCTWLFLMKNISELFSIFQDFSTGIQTQFGFSIRTLRSDNAHEYFSTRVQSLMSSCDNIHQSSCAHSPKQTGWLKGKIHNCLKQHVPSLFMSRHHIAFGEKLFLQLATWSIGYLLSFFKIKPLTPLSFPANLFTMFLFIFWIHLLCTRSYPG